MKLDNSAMQFDAAATCFLNAYLRENSNWQYDQDINTIAIILNDENTTLKVKVRHYSTVGLHQFNFAAIFIDSNNDKTIVFPELVDLIVSDLVSRNAIDPGNAKIFIKNVISSWQTTHAILERRNDITTLFNQEINYTQAEQSLLFGHSVHPAPKCRPQLTLATAKQYAPEFRAKFQLNWFLVHKNLIAQGASSNNNALSCLQELIYHEATLQDYSNNEQYVLLPAHPWQANYFCKNVTIKQYLESKAIIDLGKLGSSWYANSSMRSLSNSKLPYMLKTSLSIKLTNSIRNLSKKEVLRGTLLKDVLKTDIAKQVSSQHPTLTLMHEPAWFAIKDPDDQVIDETIVALRENPFFNQSEHECIVLAALSQNHPFGAKNMLQTRVEKIASKDNISCRQASIKWFDDFCKLIVLPLLAYQAELGIVLLSHQQNIIVRLKDNKPIGLFYRDCQGTGYSDLAFKLFPELLNSKALENYWDNAKIKRYFPYYLIFNSVFNVIAALASSAIVGEEYLLGILQKNISAYAKTKPKDETCLNYILQDAVMLCKANFNCYMQNYNENSIQDPAVIYIELPNLLNTSTKVQ